MEIVLKTTANPSEESPINTSNGKGLAVLGSSATGVAHTTGVAKNSLHMQAEAIDIRLPGLKTSKLRDLALSLARGGVGYYPASDFIHVDVGRVRRW